MDQVINTIVETVTAYPGYAVIAVLVLPLLIRWILPGKLTLAEQQALASVKARFTYKLDKDQFGVNERWYLHKDPEAPVIGDCEDFSLAVLWMLSDQSWLRFWWNVLSGKGVIWHCKSPSGVGHAMLRYKGHWVCNIFPAFDENTQNSKTFPYLLPLMVTKMWISAVLDRLR